MRFCCTAMCSTAVQCDASWQLHASTHMGAQASSPVHTNTMGCHGCGCWWPIRQHTKATHACNQGPGGADSQVTYGTASFQLMGRNTFSGTKAILQGAHPNRRVPTTNYGTSLAPAKHTPQHRHMHIIDAVMSGCCLSRQWGEVQVAYAQGAVSQKCSLCTQSLLHATRAASNNNSSAHQSCNPADAHH